MEKDSVKMSCFTVLLAFLTSIADGIMYYVSAAWPTYDSMLLFFVDCWRLFSGRWRATGLEKSKRPSQPLELYEYTACPKCKLVRETLSVLDIDHMVYPCPKESLGQEDNTVLNSRYRSVVKKELNGVIKVPFLIDKNTDARVAGSKLVVEYLWKNYGQSAVAPLNYRIAMNEVVIAVTMRMAMLCRPSPKMGMLRAPARIAEKPLELWGYEGSPFVRRVQETLCACEIQYMFHVLPWRSTVKRTEFAKEHAQDISPSRKNWGLIVVPFLKDPNTGVQMFESLDMVKYIQTKYQTAPTPNDTWLR